MYGPFLCEDSKWQIVENNEAVGNLHRTSFILDLNDSFY